MFTCTHLRRRSIAGRRPSRHHENPSADDRADRVDLPAAQRTSADAPTRAGRPLVPMTGTARSHDRAASESVRTQSPTKHAPLITTISWIHQANSGSAETESVSSRVPSLAELASPFESGTAVWTAPATLFVAHRRAWLRSLGPRSPAGNE